MRDDRWRAEPSRSSTLLSLDGNPDAVRDHAGGSHAVRDGARAFGTASRRGVSQTPYQSIILNHATFRAQYNAILTALLDPSTGPLSEAALHDFLDGVQAATTAALAADPYAGFGSEAAVAAHFDGLRSWVSERIVNVLDQVEANLPAPRT